MQPEEIFLRYQLCVDCFVCITVIKVAACNHLAIQRRATDRFVKLQIIYFPTPISLLLLLLFYLLHVRIFVVIIMFGFFFFAFQFSNINFYLSITLLWVEHPSWPTNSMGCCPLLGTLLKDATSFFGPSIIV